MLRELLIIGALALGAGAAFADGPYRSQRTADGQPDMQGEWTNLTHTPLERPKAFAGLIATPSETKAYLTRVEAFIDNMPPPPKPSEPPREPDVGQSEWYEHGIGLMRIDGALRSSIIIEPSDGKLPYNIVGQHVVEAALHRDETNFDGPEDRISDERCLMGTGGPLSPPMMPPTYNANYSILQTPGFVVIQTEMIHDIRVIRLTDRHGGGAPTWMGDSIGHWEGETLVVETLNQHPISAERFVPGESVLFITPAAKVVERFTRTGPTEIRYVFTVDDPAVYSRPWSGEVVFTPSAAPMYEYACHEGNYALANILRGARHREQEEAAAKKGAHPGTKATSAAPK